MANYLSDDELKRLKPAQRAAFRSPVPTQMISNGEFSPLPQSGRSSDRLSRQQRRHGTAE